MPLGTYSRGSIRTSINYRDLFAGVAIASVEIPTALAYAELAGFAPVVGLYASILPLIAYAMVGSSPQLIVGPDAATCALVAATLAPLALGDPARYLELSISLSFVVGVLCLAGGLLRLGSLANLLSRPILVGFLNGMALTIASGQLGKICGFSLRSDTGFFLRLADFYSKVGQTHFPTLVVGIITLVLILLFGRIVPRAPGPLVGVVVGIAIMVLFNADRWGVSTVGKVPVGLPWPRFPSTFWSDSIQLLPDAGGILLISFCGSMLSAKSFAVRNKYELNADQEFFALGMANLASALSNGFPISGTDSRTAVNDQAGGRSQLSGVCAAAIMALILALWTAPLEYIPQASLGAILILAGLSLFDFGAIRRFATVSRSECVLSLIAMIGVATVGVLPGIAMAVVLSIIVLLFRASTPHDAILGQVSGLDGFIDISEYSEAQTLPGIMVYRFDAALLFFNADYFKKRVRELVVHSKSTLKHFILDMEAVNTIDVTAIEALEEIRSELASLQIDFLIARAKRELRHSLELCGLVERIGVAKFHPSIRSAVDVCMEVDRERNAR